MDAIKPVIYQKRAPRDVYITIPIVIIIIPNRISDLIFNEPKEINNESIIEVIYRFLLTQYQGYLEL